MFFSPEPPGKPKSSRAGVRVCLRERGRCGFRVTSRAGGMPLVGGCPSKPGHLVCRMGPSPAPQFRPPTPSRSAVSGGWEVPEGNRAWRPQSTTWGETESGPWGVPEPNADKKGRSLSTAASGASRFHLLGLVGGLF